MRISYWSSDLCSSDLLPGVEAMLRPSSNASARVWVSCPRDRSVSMCSSPATRFWPPVSIVRSIASGLVKAKLEGLIRSEEHTSELQSLMRISYAVFCLKKKKQEYRQN